MHPKHCVHPIYHGWYYSVDLRTDVETLLNLSINELKNDNNLNVKILENIDYYKLNESIKNNLYSLNDRIIIKNENQENHIILCDIKYNKEEIKKINLDNRVNYLVTKISQGFINQKKIMYKFINYE